MAYLSKFAFGHLGIYLAQPKTQKHPNNEDSMIRLSKVKYTESEGTSQEWRLENLLLGEANLVVGKNASGKSRTLNVIRGLARYLAGLDHPRMSGNYDVEFMKDGEIIRYQLKYEKEQVVEEIFSIGGTVRLNRGKGGEGLIWAEELEGGKDIRFQTPTSELAAVAP